MEVVVEVAAIAGVPVQRPAAIGFGGCQLGVGRARDASEGGVAGFQVPEYAWQMSSDAPRGVNTLIDRAATWSYVDWLAAHTSLPLVVKGIMTAEDAHLCAAHGVRAIIRVVPQ